MHIEAVFSIQRKYQYSYKEEYDSLYSYLCFRFYGRKNVSEKRHLFFAAVCSSVPSYL